MFLNHVACVHSQIFATGACVFFGGGEGGGRLFVTNKLVTMKLTLRDNHCAITFQFDTHMYQKIQISKFLLSISRL